MEGGHSSLQEEKQLEDMFGNVTNDTALDYKAWYKENHDALKLFNIDSDHYVLGKLYQATAKMAEKQCASSDEVRDWYERAEDSFRKSELYLESLHDGTTKLEYPEILTERSKLLMLLGRQDESHKLEGKAEQVKRERDQWFLKDIPNPITSMYEIVAVRSKVCKQ